MNLTGPLRGHRPLLVEITLRSSFFHLIPSKYQVILNQCEGGRNPRKSRFLFIWKITPCKVWSDKTKSQVQHSALKDASSLQSIKSYLSRRGGARRKSGRTMSPDSFQLSSADWKRKFLGALLQLCSAPPEKLQFLFLPPPLCDSLSLSLLPPIRLFSVTWMLY